MVITYYGASCFKVQSGETVLVFNPPSKNSSFKSPRFQSNLVFSSINDKDYNGSDNIAGEPFLIDGPGEYEVGGVTIKGIRDGLNTIYTLSLEGMNLCHLGAFEEGKLDIEAKEEIGHVDVLFVPVRNDSDVQNIPKVISEIGPKMIVPMHFQPKDLKAFLKEVDGDSNKPIEKLSIKKKDLGEGTEVVVLSSAI